MASNTQLIESIEVAAVERNLEVPNTEGLNNAQLAALLKKVKSTETTPAVDETTPAVDPTAYHVDEGKAITTKRGIIADGDEIEPNDLPGGLEAIKAFVKSGHIVAGK